MSSESIVLLATISIVLNTVVLVLILVALHGLRQTLARLESQLSPLISRAGDELVATLRDFRGAATETKNLLHTGGRVLENVAFASLLGRSGGRLSQALAGFNLAQSLVKLLSRSGKTAKPDTTG
ncbi:MAG: hypothetical protein ACM3X4_11575 [Ignavibacteriales bacterium]